MPSWLLVNQYVSAIVEHIYSPIYQQNTDCTLDAYLKKDVVNMWEA